MLFMCSGSVRLLTSDPELLLKSCNLCSLFPEITDDRTERVTDSTGSSLNSSVTFLRFDFADQSTALSGRRETFGAAQICCDLRVFKPHSKNNQEQAAGFDSTNGSKLVPDPCPTDTRGSECVFTPVKLNSLYPPPLSVGLLTATLTLSGVGRGSLSGLLMGNTSPPRKTASSQPPSTLPVSANC